MIPQMRTSLQTSPTLTRPKASAEQAALNGAHTGGVKALNIWASQYLPLHFQQGAESRYGYAKRSPRYQQRKRNMARFGLHDKQGRQVTGSKAMHYTGDEGKVRHSPGVSSRKVGTGVIVEAVITLSHPMRVKHARELTRMTADEADTILEILFDEIVEELI